MGLPETPADKLNAVKEAYTFHIIPNIQLVYESTGLVLESFMLAHCAILSLSGFYSGTSNTGGKTYRRFVADFFSREYDPEALWRALRNTLVHAYTITSAYILAHRHPEQHLHMVKHVRSERTGELADLTVLNFESFLNDFREAASAYFSRVEGSPDLLDSLCSRYRTAAPASYVSDHETSGRLIAAKVKAP
jgi:hypothetical protein